MSNEDYRALPAEVLSAFFGLIVTGIALGLLYGAGVLSGVALTLAVMSGNGCLCSVGAVKLDPRGIAELPEQASEDE